MANPTEPQGALMVVWERIVHNRSNIWLGFWLFLLCVFCLLFLFDTFGVVGSLEKVMLDFRTRGRFEMLSATDQIAMIALDEVYQGQEEIRRHLHLPMDRIPRRNLAQIIDYASEQGAKTIVLDLRLSKPDTPEDDQALEDAITRAGNVFVVGRFRKTFEEFVGNKTKAQQREGGPTTNGDDPGPLAMVVDTQRTQILADRLAQFYARWYGRIPGGVLALETVVPMGMGWRVNPQQFHRAWSKGVIQSGMNPSWSFIGATYTEKTFEAFLHWWSRPTRLYQVCQQGQYRARFASDPEFLSFLMGQAMTVDWQSVWPSKRLKEDIYCDIDPLIQRYRPGVKGFSHSNVLYSRDEQNIYKFPVLVEGYLQQAYPYISLQVARDVLGKPPLTFASDHVWFGERKIPLYEENRVLINWKSPSMAMAREWKRGEFVLVASFLPTLLTRQEGIQFHRFESPGEFLDHMMVFYAHVQGQHLSRRYPYLSQWIEALDQRERLDLTKLVITHWETIRGFQWLNNTSMALNAHAYWWNHVLPWDYAIFGREAQRLRQEMQTGYLANETLEALTPVQEKQMLNSGLLYRTLSALEVLVMKNVGPHAESGPLANRYQLPYLPASGFWSLKDKIVIIGEYVTDTHPSPIASITHGPEALAAILDMMLYDKTFVHQLPWYQNGLIYVVLIIWMMVCILRYKSLLTGIVLAFCLLSVYWSVCVTMFVQNGLWLPMIQPTLVSVLALMAGLAYKYNVQDQESRHLTEALSNYVSPQLMNTILLDPARSAEALKGTKQELTVLFSDLRCFTQTFEEADPMEMVSQLNEYLDTMTQVILNHQGCLDKYMGDAIMAIFGAPLHYPTHAEQAVATAVEMEKAMKVLNQKWEAEGRPQLRQSIGISTGEMFVGNFGSRNIKNFTVMGSAVNLGARLESYTRQVNATIIVSEETFKRLADRYEFFDLGRIEVKGFSQTVQAYALVAEKHGAGNGSQKG